MQNAVRDLIQDGLVRSAHDCSEGGLAVALAECCFNPAGPLGAEVTLAALPDVRHDELLFNESQSRIILSVAGRTKPTTFDRNSSSAAFRSPILGSVGGEELRIRVSGSRSTPGPSPSCMMAGSTRSPARWKAILPLTEFRAFSRLNESLNASPCWSTIPDMSAELLTERRASGIRHVSAA